MSLTQILKLKTASERVGTIIENQESGYEDLKTMISSIKNILDHDDIEEQFVKQIPSVGITLKKFNAVMIGKKDLSQVTEEVFHNYNLLTQHIEKDPTITENIRIKILELLESLKDFDDIYLGIAMTRQKQLEQALMEVRNDGEIKDLEENIAGTALAFFCLLFAKEGIEDKKLEKLSSIAYRYSRGLESWADTIDIMSNPESVEAIKEAAIRE